MTAAPNCTAWLTAWPLLEAASEPLGAASANRAELLPAENPVARLLPPESRPVHITIECLTVYAL
ncbi:MAG: hypothetical protein LBJ64_06950 [Deltaproteobacteria bacterium]|nr:hypothetical protein [Deltaproteobacteria bacterium]